MIPIKININKYYVILYNEKLSIRSIEYFTKSKRSENDTYNKYREIILCGIINNKIPQLYYKHSTEWNTMREGLMSLINTLHKDYTTIQAIWKGHRNNSIDLLLLVDDIEYPYEFKYGTNSVNNAPQFVSPMKPSQYMIHSMSYEEFYYDNYLTIIAKNFGLDLPDKDTYLKQIHGNNPECMKPYTKLYYEGVPSSSRYTGNKEAIEFYQQSKELSQKSIEEYLKQAQLDTERLSNYLLSKQKNKNYICYNDGIWYKDSIDETIFTIQKDNVEITKNSYICITQSGVKLKILLRWKNGNGIAYPAFQISMVKR